jgi:L-lactate dehydrogenase
MKVSIVGMGKVGSALAFSLVSRGAVEELVLAARDPRRAAGDALDLQHAAVFSRPVRVRAGELADAAGSDVIVLAASSAEARAAAATVAAGGPEPAGGARLTMALPNARLVGELAPQLAAGSPGAVFIVITNPIDVATYIALKSSGLPAGRVMGTGTLVDTARFRAALSAELGIHANDIRAYILGEHGDSQFGALSVASAGGAPLGMPPERVRALAHETRRGGHEVVRYKGYTNYAVAAAATLLVEAVLQNTRIVAPVSTLIDGYQGVRDVCLSVPAVIGRGGVQRTLNVELDESEAAAFRESAAVVRQILDAVSGA